MSDFHSSTSCRSLSTVLPNSPSCQTSLRALRTIILEEGRGQVLVPAVVTGQGGTNPPKHRVLTVTRHILTAMQRARTMHPHHTISHTVPRQGVRARARGSTPTREALCIPLWASRHRVHMLVLVIACTSI